MDKKKNRKKEIYSWIKSIVVALLVLYVVRSFIFTPAIVQGESMMPNLQDGNRLILSKLSDVNRFDDIVFDAPDQDERYIKRVIGLPGDTVEMKDDTLYINEKPYKEKYLDQNRKLLSSDTKLTGNFTLNELTGKTVVPKGKLFVLGDNRLYSKDSRIFGFISEKSIYGKVVYRIWPLTELGDPK